MEDKQEMNMAKVLSNPVVQGLSGSLGRELMFRRLADGRTILCVKPDFSRRILSEQQQTHHRRFREASVYARNAAKSQPVYAERAAGTLKTAYNIALADWFHPPVIHAVEVRDGHIRVRASDDVLVARVRITCLDANDGQLEQGEAAQMQGQWWQYTPQRIPGMQDRLIAEAWDLAGNLVRMEK
jgi:hypothetical protein